MYRSFCFVFALSLFFSCGNKNDIPSEKQFSPASIQRPDWKKFYDSAKVEGCFALYDLQKDQWLFCDSIACSKRHLPASTFKICNSLIALECGLVKDENEIIKWDGTKRRIDAWNADTDMKNAFKNSTVWFYQELARRTGKEKMKMYLEKLHYGNADTSGGIDQFWLTGNLRISPIEQVNFLRQLQNNALPVSQRSMDIVKRIMINEDSASYLLRGKTGWGFEGAKEVGWFAGYLEKKNGTYFFANFVECADTLNENFGKCRKEITKKILHDLELF